MNKLLIIAVLLMTAFEAKSRTVADGFELSILPERASDIGIELSTEQVDDAIFVSISITNTFPCDVESIDLSLLDGNQRPYLNASLALNNNQTAFFLEENRLNESRIAIHCATPTKDGVNGYNFPIRSKANP